MDTLHNGYDKIKYNNDYNKLNYDRLNIQAPKGTKEPLKDYYKEAGYKSLNDYVMHLIKTDLESALSSVNETKRLHADNALSNILNRQENQ